MAKSTKASEEAGIMIPPTQEKVETNAGKLIKQLTTDELFAELDDETLMEKAKELAPNAKNIQNQVDAFLAIHHEQMDANYLKLSEVLNWDTWDVTDRLKEIGYIFPAGV